MIIANIEDYRKQCEARLPRFLFDYISGGSFQENSLRANMRSYRPHYCANV